MILSHGYVFVAASCAGLLLSIAQATEMAEVRASFLGYEAPVPSSWLAEPASSSMRLIQYQVPAPAEGDPGQLIVYYFGPGQGGPVDANIARWQGQFSTPDGDPVTPQVDRFVVNGLPVTTAEFHGEYARGIGMGPVGKPKPDQILLAAIIETPKGNLIVQLHGHAATVEAHRDGYMSFIQGMRTAEP